VYALLGDEMLRMALSDADGRFRIDALPPGRIDIIGSHKTLSERIPVWVGKERSQELRVQLLR
jgi:hypothetical protein